MNCQAQTLEGDVARVALLLFQCCRNELPRVLRECEGGRNVLAAGLGPDIDFAARLNVLDVVGVAGGNPLTVRRILD